MRNSIPNLILDPLIDEWLREDIGRGDRTSQALFAHAPQQSSARFLLKQPGVVAGLAIALRVFERLEPTVETQLLCQEGEWMESGETLATVAGSSEALLMAERVALNLLMKLSGIATLTRQYADVIQEFPTTLVDTRKTTPGLRILEKYATQIGGAKNHRFGLDDAIMLKDNHIQAAGSIPRAIAAVRNSAPYPLNIEVETETLDQVKAAVENRADIIMLDNMPPEQMKQAVAMIRAQAPHIKIEASGNITLSTLRAAAQTGVDFISTSATITQASWLDISLKFD